MTLARFRNLKEGDPVLSKSPTSFRRFKGTIIRKIDDTRAQIEYEGGKRTIKSFKTLEEAK